MPDAWQDATAGALALLALAWLIRSLLRRRRRPTLLCGDCPGCAPPEGTGPQPATGCAAGCDSGVTGDIRTHPV